MLSSDPAIAIGIGSRTVIKLNPEEVSIVVCCVELETQASEGATEIIQLNSGLAGVWRYIVKANFKGEAPADVSSPILDPECVALLSTLAQVVKTKGHVVPTGQQLMKVTEGSTTGRVETGVIKAG